MSAIVVSLTNVHIDEQHELRGHLESNYWKTRNLTKDEIQGIISIISKVIDSRKGDDFSELSYLDLINLKAKLKEL